MQKDNQKTQAQKTQKEDVLSFASNRQNGVDVLLFHSPYVDGHAVLRKYNKGTTEEVRIVKDDWLTRGIKWLSNIADREWTVVLTRNNMLSGINSIALPTKTANLMKQAYEASVVDGVNEAEGKALSQLHAVAVAAMRGATKRNSEVFDPAEVSSIEVAANTALAVARTQPSKAGVRR